MHTQAHRIVDTDPKRGNVVVHVTGTRHDEPTYQVRQCRPSRSTRWRHCPAIDHHRRMDGCRWGELTGLHRDNLDLDRGILIVDPRFGALHESAHEQCLGNPKTTSSARVVTPPPFLITLLRDYLKQHDNEFVFTADGGTWLWRSTFTQRILKPAIKGNEDGPHNRARTVAIRPGLTFHGLRHSHKTWLIADGAPEIAQARRLGHHLPNRVTEVYSHVAPEVEQRLLNNLQRR